MSLTTNFDAAEFLTSTESRYGFLLESLEPPVSLKSLSGSVAIAARAAGGVDALAKEANISNVAIEDAIHATSLECAMLGLQVLLDGLRRHIPASRLVA